MLKIALATLAVLLLLACGDGEAENPAASEPISGKAVYNDNCGTCHDSGANGSPALGDQAAWAARVPEWTGLLKDHATRGFLEMQPMGGRFVLSEDAVAAAVDYMLGQIKPTSATGVIQNLTKGRAVYVARCGLCHDTGEHGAPVLGNDAAWAERSPFWEAVLAEHVEGGFLAMPAKAGDPQLSSEDVAAAVEYMISWESIP